MKKIDFLKGMKMITNFYNKDFNEEQLNEWYFFFEDVDAEPWVMDHMLSHMRNAGKLDDAVGFVVGECSGCVPRKLDPGYFSDMTVEDVLDYYLKPLGKPVLYGLPLGHCDDLATLPLGVMTRLEADKKTFTVLESGVI